MKIKTRSYLLFGSLFLLSSLIVACNPVPDRPVSVTIPVTQKMAALENPTPPQSPHIDDATGENGWRTTATFTGEGNENISPFHISSTKWRIRWVAAPANLEHNAFNILVYREDLPKSPIKIISNSNDIISDTSFIEEGERDYHIKVIAANLRGWSIKVDDHIAAPPLHPVQITRIHYRGKIYPPNPGNGICYERIEPDEYVAIKNLGDNWEDIRGWALKNVSKGYISFTFPDYFSCYPTYFDNYCSYTYSCVPPVPCILGPHQSILVYTDVFYPETGGLSFYYGQGNIWNNETPETAVLYNAAGEEVSRKSYIVPPVN